jgi:deoxycytidine triphosphate deaminase
MYLGSDALRRGLNDGSIVCDPPPISIESAHLDVTLGEWYWIGCSSQNYMDMRRSQRMGWESALPVPWQTYHTHLTGDIVYLLYHASQTNDAILVMPDSITLAHTHEFVGSPRVDLVATLDTRSTMARLGLPIHMSAGRGDLCFCSRWTLEIATLIRQRRAIPVGAHIGSVAFSTVVGGSLDTAYRERYNVPKATWTPDAMLPRHKTLVTREVRYESTGL